MAVYDDYNRLKTAVSAGASGEKHDVSDTVFLVDYAKYLAA